MVFCPEFVHRQHGGRWLPSLRLAVVGGKACHKCLVTWLRPLCLVSERVDHWKRGLYGSIVGWHIGLFVRHMRIFHFANINFCVFSSFLSCLIAKQQFSRLVSLSVFLVGQLKGSGVLGSVRNFCERQGIWVVSFREFSCTKLRFRSCSLVSRSQPPDQVRGIMVGAATSQ